MILLPSRFGAVTTLHQRQNDVVCLLGREETLDKPYKGYNFIVILFKEYLS